MTLPPFLRSRVLAGGIHLASSLVVAGLAWLLVFKLWYPTPFATVAGGTQLFLLVVGVDVICGPTLTAIVAGPRKPRKELARDLSVIVLLQLSALAYGLYTMAQARPIGVVYEYDLFRVVTAVDVEAEALSEAPPELRSLSWTGPRIFAVVKPTDPEEQLRTIQLGLAQIQLASLPRYWRDYASQGQRAWLAAKPMSEMLQRYPGATADVAAIAKRAGHPVEALRFLPLASRHASWTVVLAPGAHVIGYLDYDPF